jgi:hypothetical protein
MKLKFKANYEESKKKFMECNDVLRFNDKIIDISLYLLKISLEDKNIENRNAFMKDIKIINKIKEMTKKLDNKDDMMRVLFIFDFFTKKYSHFPNIKYDLQSLNNIWYGINKWDNDVIY